MSMTAHIFHFREDDSIKRLPMAQWNRIQRREACFSDCNNQIIRLAFAYIELLDRKPLYCDRIEGLKYRIDQAGMYDEYYTLNELVSPLGTLMDTSEETPSIIKVEARFKMRRYQSRCLWSPTPEQVNRVVALIWYR